MERLPRTGQLEASCRIAFAALTHDLGKFAERAALRVNSDSLKAHVTNYCRWHDQGKYHSHKHAAYTALFLDHIEKTAPDLIDGETAPFASRKNEHDITDSLINAAAMHHRPETLLQWIIATADRVASGFEREEFDKYNESQERTSSTGKSGRNHYQARLLPLYEQVRLERSDSCTYAWRSPLRPLSPENLFPVKAEGYEPAQDAPAQEEYRLLWEQFFNGLQMIPDTHRASWPLWLDHFDTLWQSYTHAIPSATAFNIRPEVSLYDHSKATAAFAVALWRWHIAQEDLKDQDAVRHLREGSDWATKKFLLIQGDFFGIQDFIFAEGSETNKRAAKLLRGRSFMVSLFTELAALKVLDILDLPSTSQIINAAGKFLIIGPNTSDIREKLVTARKSINDWFLEHTYGLAGLGLVWNAASCKDFLSGRFDSLMKNLFADLETEKLHRFDLTAEGSAVRPADYPLNKICQYNNRLPADKQEEENKGSARLSRDQIAIGDALANQKRHLLFVSSVQDSQKLPFNTLEMPIFDYRVGFIEKEELNNQLEPLLKTHGLVRCWDFSLANNLTDTLWHGYARRYINAYVPRFSEHDQLMSDKYRGGVDVDEICRPGDLKTLNHLACEDRILSTKGNDDTREKQWIGQIALTSLKGDVDNLGLIFQEGLRGKSSFAKMAALSRQTNSFFAIWLPAFCKQKFPNCYTVFAGGDDFFLIGPWHSTQQLAAEMAKHFKGYVAENPEIHFSAGMVMTKPKHPINTLAQRADEALDAAKGYTTAGRVTKNAVSIFNEVVPWEDWQKLEELEMEVQRCADRYKLSTGYIYGLLRLIDLAADKRNIESVMWHSRFAYRTKRYVVDKLAKNERDGAHIELTEIFGKSIGTLKSLFRIPLFNHFYSKR